MGSINVAIEQLEFATVEPYNNQTSIDMFDSFDNLSASCVSIIVGLPIVSGNASPVCTPLAFLATAFMFIKPIMLTR